VDPHALADATLHPEQGTRAGVYGPGREGLLPREWVDTLRRRRKLCGHISHHVPGWSSPPVARPRLPVAAGMALRQRNKRGHRIFCLMSDGDCNEGSLEAIMFAAQHGFDNLTAIVDANKIQAWAR